jgi:hypothetical protein
LKKTACSGYDKKSDDFEKRLLEIQYLLSLFHAETTGNNSGIHPPSWLQTPMYILRPVGIHRINGAAGAGYN